MRSHNLAFKKSPFLRFHACALFTHFQLKLIPDEAFTFKFIILGIVVANFLLAFTIEVRQTLLF